MTNWWFKRTDIDLWKTRNNPKTSSHSVCEILHIMAKFKFPRVLRVVFALFHLVRESSNSDLVYCGGDQIEFDRWRTLAELVNLETSVTTGEGFERIQVAFTSSWEMCHTWMRKKASEKVMFFLVNRNEAEFLDNFLNVSLAVNEFYILSRPVWKSTFVLYLPLPISNLQQRLDFLYSKTSNARLPVSSDVFIVARNTESDNVLYEAFDLNSTLVIKEVPAQPRFGVSITDKMRWRQNFSGVRIRACSARDPTSWLVPPISTAHNPVEILDDGTAGVLFSEIKFALKFSYEPEELIRSDWISRHKNGTLKGVTVELFRNREVDIFLGIASLLPYRATELSFLQPSFWESINGFFIQPEASSLRDLILDTFPYTIWICIFITYVVIFLTLVLFMRFSKRSHRFNGEVDALFGLDKLIWTIGTLCQQGWHIAPSWTPYRIVFFCGYITGLLSYIAFSAAIVSVLSVQVLPIKSRSDLLNSQLKVYADNKSSTMAYVVNDLRAHTKAKFGSPVSIEGGIAKLRSLKPNTFLAFPHYFYLLAGNMSLSEEWICRYLSTLPVTLSPTPHAMIVGKNSEYFEPFNYVLVKRIERGLNHRFVLQYNVITTTRCLRDMTTPPPSISFGDVFSSYAVLSVGMVAGFLAYVVEKCKMMGESRKEDEFWIHYPGT